MNLGSSLSSLPPVLTIGLIEEFGELHKNYFMGKWGPSQLNGGRFGEIALRILQFLDTGQYTAIGTQLQRLQIINHINNNTSLEDSIRLYVPALIGTIMDFRNNRNVAHPGSISVNEMDATLVIHTANWIMAEIIRVEGQLQPVEAQNIISRLIEIKVPIIEEIGGKLKILDPKLTAKKQILVILYQMYPIQIEDQELFKLVDEKNISRFKRNLKEQSDKQKYLDYHQGMVQLTKRGLIWVEKNIDFELQV